MITKIANNSSRTEKEQKKNDTKFNESKNVYAMKIATNKKDLRLRSEYAGEE